MLLVQRLIVDAQLDKHASELLEGARIDALALTRLLRQIEECAAEALRQRTTQHHAAEEQ